MTTSTPMTHPPLAPADLAAEGFTADRASRLSKQRKRYNPAREYFREPEVRRPSFLGWRVPSGRAQGLAGRG